MAREHFNKTCCFIKGLKKRCRHNSHWQNKTCPLSQSNHSGKVKVCSVSGDRKTCAQMAHLGLLPGQEIELICRGNKSQCLVKVNGGTISLDQVLAENIIIAPV